MLRCPFDARTPSGSGIEVSGLQSVEHRIAVSVDSADGSIVVDVAGVGLELPPLSQCHPKIGNPRAELITSDPGTGFVDRREIHGREVVLRPIVHPDRVGDDEVLQLGLDGPICCGAVGWNVQFDHDVCNPHSGAELPEHGTASRRVADRTRRDPVDSRPKTPDRLLDQRLGPRPDASVYRRRKYVVGWQMRRSGRNRCRGGRHEEDRS